MRIDVITLHAIKNYGSVLQAFATQEIFKKYGYDVRIINYVREDAREENIVDTWAGGNILKRVIIWPTVLRWRQVFGSFLRKNLNISPVVYTTDSDFKEYPLDADAYCTGSDQVWNSVWNKGIIKPLYLSFVPDDMFKFAFAASFGQERLSQEEVDATKKYIDAYNFISVREDSAKKIVEQQYDYPNAVHVLDPTLNLTGDEWRKAAKTQKKNGNYILIYNLNRSKAFDDYAKKLSQKTGLKLVRFCTRYDQILRVGKSKLVPEVFEFVRLIDNASYVLTDSFHATAFSMNLNTEPICVYPQEFGGRIDSFLNLLESQNRHIRDYNDFDIVNRKVNFALVNSKLDAERYKTNNYLEAVFRELNNSIDS